MMHKIIAAYLTFALLLQCLATGHMELRLVNGTAWSGRLEVFHDGKWKTMCSPCFDDTDLKVVCRSLGFSGSEAVTVRSDLYGQGSGFIFRKHVQCSGAETSFSQCEFGSIYRCEHWMDVGVICNSPGELTPRLVNGAHWSGRLEILVNRKWSSMYELEFGNSEAQVVCRMLGLNSPGAVSVTSDMYGVASEQTLSVKIKCTGAESKLSECKRDKLKINDLHHFANVGVICNIPGQITPRLVEGNASSGRLEILHNGTWNLVCDEGFGLQEAEVACRMLGFDSHGEASVRSLVHGNSSTRTISGNLTCRGTERSLAECKHPGFNTIDCKKSLVISISCSVPADHTLRLANGHLWSGRLEIFYNQRWRSLCDAGFGQREAQVVCGMLNYSSPGATYDYTGSFGSGSEPVRLAYVKCAGTETSLLRCSHDGLYDQVCGPLDDIAVICNIPGQFVPRLADGSAWSGRLDLLYNGSWSSVCDDGFGHKEARVACRMLGFDSPKVFAVNSFLFRDHDGTVLFSDLDCQGTETDLTQCNYSSLYNNKCIHGSDIAVVCKVAGPRRTSDYMGRLVILVGPLARKNDWGGEDIVLSRMWSGVCGNNYSPITTARVICKQLGYPSRNAMLVPGSSFGPMNSFWITEGNCTGDEISMIACVQLITGYSSSCPTQDIGVVCSDSNPGLYILLETFGKDDVYPPFEGSNVSLKCEGTKKIHSAAIYTWTETAGGRPSGAHLIFDSLAKENSGRRVKCEAHFYYNGSSHEKLSSEAIKLQVYYKPLIRITSDVNTCQPHATSDTCYITMGHNVTLVCSAESNPVPVSFEWFNKTMATREKLNIISANALRHEGIYNCTVQTKSDDYDKRLPLSAFYVFTIIVQEPPVLVGFSANGEDNTTITVDENSNVSLSCEAAGRPKPHMVLRSDANSRELNRIAHDDSQSKEKTSNIYFFIHKIRCQDSGAYRCEADNSVGHENRTLFILVPCAPRLRDLQGELPPVTIINFKESFTLELIAYPPPEVKQMYYGPVNDTLGGQLKDLLDVTCGAKTFAPALFTCNITVVNKSDDGVYRIVFENDHGQLPFNFTRKILS